MKWKRERRAWKSAGFVLKLLDDTTIMRVEPWSRALRVAEAFKGPETSVEAFIKDQGGINRCAARIREVARKRR
jgi:hypothetical protein